jgi:GTPase SAR1 family protein
MVLKKEIMRIAISGAQSVGKTTILNALRSEKIFKDYHIANEVTRRVQSYGLPINENGTDLTQRLIMQEHIVNTFMYDNFIADRSAWDGFVYSCYLWTTGRISFDTMNYSKHVFMKVQPTYDIQFYIEPEFDIVHDGVRSINKAFRDDIIRIFDSTIEDYKMNAVILRGSVRERVEQVLNAIKEKNEQSRRT